MYFGSDNQTGASSRILEMIARANTGHTHGYGDDEWTHRALDKLKQTFECELDAYFVSTGTAANCLAIACLVEPWEALLCHAQAHVFIDESTAPEGFTGGARILGIARGEGKMNSRHIADYIRAAGTDYPHNVRVGALSLTQATECGLVYSPEEISALCAAAQEHGLKVHMDGARFSNAVAALGCKPADISWKAGVQALSLGATKNGALAAEAVIFFRRGLSEQFLYRRKRAGHLLSKGRFFGAQFIGWLEDDHWLELAGHANRQARLLASALSKIAGVRIVWPTQANEVFAVIPSLLAERLRGAGAEFHEWYREALPTEVGLQNDEVFIRLVTSFATEARHIEEFCRVARGKPKD